MSENDVLDLCKDTYKLLRNTLKHFNETDSLNNKVKLLFQKVGGNVYFKQSSDKYVSYDGSVDNYTIAGSISIDYANADFTRLIEDLTMAIYKNNGGTTITFTPELIRLCQQ